ncbi:MULTISPECIES: hypothetical protein [unclassified Saccharothrix]|uniref:hypothetical protein n=1 Tax=unclassified Saccharothrix TaxID=2593673 RepID=UPI00307DF6B3
MQTGRARDIHIGDRHDERRGVVALAVVAVVLVVAVVVVVVVALVRAPGGGTAGTAVPGGQGVTTAGRSAPSESLSESPSVDETREVTLRPGTGIDLESDATVGHKSAGPSGGLDLHLDTLNLLRPDTGGFVRDSGSTPSRGRCAEAVAPGDGEAQIFPVQGEQHCFVTSGGDIAWLRVKESTILDPSDKKVVFDVVVW